MNDPTGFLRYQRKEAGKQLVDVRIRHWHEYEQIMPPRFQALLEEYTDAVEHVPKDPAIAPSTT